MTDVLRAPFALEYTYTRSVGPILGRFFAGLRDGRILGVRTSSGTVVVPPTEYDPVTSDAVSIDDLAEVGPEGEVVTWTWLASPRGTRQPLDHPFAWALIKLDGADTAMLHAVDADESKLHAGARVRVRWAPERIGSIRDIECFEVV